MKNLKELFQGILTTKNEINVIFIRHAQSSTGVQGLIAGQTDIPITNYGEQQASQVNKLLPDIDFTKFTGIYSSDLQRCYNTCRLIVGPKYEPLIQKRTILREFDFGERVGTKIVGNIVKIKENGERLFKSMMHFQIRCISFDYIPEPNAEQWPQFWSRQNSFLQSLNVGNYIAVAHGVYLASLLKQGFGEDSAFRNCGMLAIKLNNKLKVRVPEKLLWKWDLEEISK